MSITAVSTAPQIAQMQNAQIALVTQATGSDPRQHHGGAILVPPAISANTPSGNAPKPVLDLTA